MSRNTILLLVIGGVLILIGIPLTLYLLSQQQDPRSRASEVIYPEDTGFTQQTQTSPTPPGGSTQQTCEAPTSPGGVFIQFPHTSGTQQDLNQADCVWEGVNAATGYNVKITQVDNGTVVRDEPVSGSTTSVVFPITQEMTYRCEVAAVSSCGSVSSINSAEQTCSVEGFISPSPSPSPTTPVITPTTPPPLTTTIPPTEPPTAAPPQATPPPTGTSETLLIGGGLAAVITILGAAFLFW